MKKKNKKIKEVVYEFERINNIKQIFIMDNCDELITEYL